MGVIHPVYTKTTTYFTYVRQSFVKMYYIFRLFEVDKRILSAFLGDRICSANQYSTGVVRKEEDQVIKI